MLRLMNVRTSAAAMALIATSVLAGCTHSAGDVRARPPVTASPVDKSSFRLDGGALTVSGAAAARPTVPRSTAARILASTYLPVPGPLTPVLASVTFHGRAGGGPDALSAVHLDLAWVYKVREIRRRSNCSPTFSQATPPTIPDDASYTTALVVDATTGRAYEYLGTGTGPCQPSPAPTLLRAFLHQSVRFKIRRTGPRSFTQTTYLPACGRFSTGSYGPTLLQAVASVDTGPCHQSPRTLVQHLGGRVRDLPHAPVGLICWQSFDPIYGRPADCVAES